MDPLKLPSFVAKRKIFCRKFSSVYPCRLFCFFKYAVAKFVLWDKDILKFAGECTYYARNSDPIKGNEKQRILRIPTCFNFNFYVT